MKKIRFLSIKAAIQLLCIGILIFYGIDNINYVQKAEAAEQTLESASKTNTNIDLTKIVITVLVLSFSYGAIKTFQGKEK